MIVVSNTSPLTNLAAIGQFDFEGRHAAQRLKLQVIGVVGILLAAKAKGEIERLHPLLDSLRTKAGFYLSDSVYQMALGLAKEL